MSGDEYYDKRRHGKYTHDIRLEQGDGPYEHHHQKWLKLAPLLGGFPSQFLKGIPSDSRT